MMVVDSEGKVREANRAMEETFGYTGGELTELGVKQLIHPDDLSQSMTLHEPLRSGKSNRTAVSEVRFLRKDAQILWGRHVASAIRGADGQLLSTISMIENISERHRLEEQLLQSQKMEGIGGWLEESPMTSITCLPRFWVTRH